MKRSKWKSLFIKLTSIKKFNNNASTKKLVEMPRSMSIAPKFKGFEFKVYSGRTFKKLLIVKDMFGHKFGEFCPTRSKFEFKKKKKKK